MPFPLPGSELVSPDALSIFELVAKKIGRAQEDVLEAQGKLRVTAKSSSRSLFDDIKTETTKEWLRERKKMIATLQNELDLLIYRYFDLTDQEIMLIEDTIQVFKPSSTPATWISPQTVTLDNANETTVKSYVGYGLKAYQTLLTTTLNKWAKREGSEYRVSAEGGADDKTGLAMITINVAF